MEVTQMAASGHDTFKSDAVGAGSDEPAILEEIEVEDLAVDGICGVY
jgi:mycofactocin precursor